MAQSMSNKLYLRTLLGIALLPVLLLTGCASTSEQSPGLARAQAKEFLSPLLVASLQEAPLGKSILLADPPWAGQTATKLDHYFAASGKNCIRFQLNASAAYTKHLICEQKDGFWARVTNIH